MNVQQEQECFIYNADECVDASSRYSGTISKVPVTERGCSGGRRKKRSRKGCERVVGTGKRTAGTWAKGGERICQGCHTRAQIYRAALCFTSPQSAARAVQRAARSLHPHIVGYTR